MWLSLCGCWAVSRLPACGANLIPQPSAGIGRLQDQSIGINLPLLIVANLIPQPSMSMSGRFQAYEIDTIPHLHFITSSGQTSDDPFTLRSAPIFSTSIRRTLSESATIMLLVSGMKSARQEGRPHHKYRTSLVSGADTSSNLQRNTMSRMTVQSEDEIPAGVYPSSTEREACYIALRPPGGAVIQHRLYFAERAHTEIREKTCTVGSLPIFESNVTNGFNRFQVLISKVHGSGNCAARVPVTVCDVRPSS